MEQKLQQEAVEAAKASMGSYCSIGGNGGYHHRLCVWPHFSASTSAHLTSTDTSSCCLSDVALHWLQIQSVRVLRTSAAEYFAVPKFLRYPPARIQPLGRRTIRLPIEHAAGALNFLCAGVFVQALVRGHRARGLYARMYMQEQQRRCSIFLQAAQRGHVGRQLCRRELWAKRSKDAAVLLTRAAIAKLEIIAAGAVRFVIWRMIFMKAVLKLQSCCRGWRARNSNEYSRRRRIKSKIIRRLQNDSAITKLQRKIRAFNV